MYLRSLIQKRFAQNNLNLFDRFGHQIPASKIQKEYNQIKAYLTNYVYQDEALAIMATKDYRYMLTMLACMEIGLPYIPLKNNYPQDRVDQIREDIYFSTVMTDSLLEEILSSPKIAPRELKKISDQTPLYIIFTSGSTGRPKGVIIPRGACANYFSWIERYYKDVDERDHFLQITEFTFDISLIDIAFFLTKNVQLYFSQFEKDIFKLAYEIETYKITTISTVPNNLNMLLEDFLFERADYSSLKEILIGGARFSFGLYQKCQKHFQDKNIYNLYGPTECTIYTHVKKICFDEKEDLHDHTVSIGSPIPGVVCEILENELLLGGKQLMLGYANNSEKTQEALIQTEGRLYYKSGDVSFCDESGQYFITGRKDDTIKYRGFRINLLDIDSYINRLDYISDSCTIAIPDDLKENTTICFLKAKEEKALEELRSDLAQILLEYQIPEKIFFIKEYPVNTSGKVCKKQLTELYLKEYR